MHYELKGLAPLPRERSARGVHKSWCFRAVVALGPGELPLTTRASMKSNGVRLRYFEARTPDTLTEVQEHTITWHFQDADDEFADVQVW